jgi:dihydroneopterin aldolase
MRRPVTLDIEIERDLAAAGRSDRIRQTVHYKRVFEGDRGHRQQP